MIIRRTKEEIERLFGTKTSTKSVEIKKNKSFRFRVCGEFPEIDMDYGLDVKYHNIGEFSTVSKAIQAGKDFLQDSIPLLYSYDEETKKLLCFKVYKINGNCKANETLVYDSYTD